MNFPHSLSERSGLVSPPKAGKPLAQIPLCGAAGSFINYRNLQPYIYKLMLKTALSLSMDVINRGRYLKNLMASVQGKRIGSDSSSVAFIYPLRQTPHPLFPPVARVNGSSLIDKLCRYYYSVIFGKPQKAFPVWIQFSAMRAAELNNDA